MKKSILLISVLLMVVCFDALGQTYSTIKSGSFFDASIWADGEVPGGFSSTFITSSPKQSYTLKQVSLIINDSVTVDGKDFTDTSAHYFVNETSGSLEVTNNGQLLFRNLNTVVNKGNIINSGEIQCLSGFNNYWLRYQNGRPSLCTEGSVENSGSFCTATPLLQNCQFNGIQGNTPTICGPTSSVESVQLVQQVKIYPNPVSDVINVLLPTSRVEVANYVNIQIFDVLGNKVHELQAIDSDGNYQVNVALLTPGWYYVEVSNDSNHSRRRVGFTKTE